MACHPVLWCKLCNQSWGTTEMGDHWELCTQGYVGGPMSLGTNENMVERVTQGANEMGDQWELRTQGYTWGGGGGGAMRWGTNENMVERATKEDQCDWRPMRTVYPGLRWGTNEMGDQWDRVKSVRLGEPMRWGTNENCITRVTLGDQWDGGANENRVERVSLGDQWDGGPMRTV